MQLGNKVLKENMKTSEREEFLSLEFGDTVFISQLSF